MRVSVKNVGTGDLSGAAVPLLAVDDRNTLIQPSTFNNTFAKCPSLATAGRRSAPTSPCAAAWSTWCPTGGTLVKMSYRPLQAFEPITWDGTITPAPLTAAQKKAAAKKKAAPRRPTRRRQTRRSRTSLTALAPTTRLPALQLGSLEVTTPVVLAPMAGITNAAYRRLCREQGLLGRPGSRPSSGSADTAGVSTSAR